MGTYRVTGFGRENIDVIEADRYFLEDGCYTFFRDHKTVAMFARHGVYSVVKVEEGPKEASK